MKKTLLLIIVLLLLIAAFFLVVNRGDTTNSPIFSDREIAVEDIEDVDKIFIRHRAKDGFFLKKKDDGRWYKDDTLLVSKPIMSNLTGVLANMTIKYIPQGPEADGIKRRLNQIGIEVKLFDKQNNMLRDYWVGANTNKEDGTAFLVNGAEQPYVMELPFSTGTLRTFFQIKDANIRDKHVMSLDPDDILEVAIDYPKNTESAFIVNRIGEDYSAEPFYKTGDSESRSLNPKAIENFLLEFENLVSESYENNNNKRENIESTVPFMICKIKMKDGENKSLKFYPLSKFLDQEPDPNSRRTLELVDRFFMTTNDKDFFIVQHRLYKNIMVTYNFFYL